MWQAEEQVLGRELDVCGSKGSELETAEGVRHTHTLRQEHDMLPLDEGDHGWLQRSKRERRDAARVSWTMYDDSSEGQRMERRGSKS